MSDVEQEEITSQPEASTEDQALETQGQPEQASEPTGIPEKFIEASKVDVIRSYQEVEKDRGRLANELGELRKKQEQMEEQYRLLEAQRLQQQTAPVQQDYEQQELDPLSVYDSKFDEDPREAIRQTFELQQQKLENAARKARLESQASKAAEYYLQQKQENPDFARREPVMQQLGQQFQHMIAEEYQNSPEIIRALDLMSKGLDIDYYTKNAAVESQKHRASVAEEKRRAQSQQATSAGDVDSYLDPNLSHEEWLARAKKLYGHSDKE